MIQRRSPASPAGAFVFGVLPTVLYTNIVGRATLGSLRTTIHFGRRVMFTDKTLGIVGSGRMAKAMIGGILKQGLLPASQIIASGPREERGSELHKEHRVRVTTNNGDAVTADIVILSVKPQTMPAVLKELHGKIRPDALVLSIAAGIRLATLSEGLGYSAVVRAMPNTPGQINSGITAWTCTAEVTAEQRAQATALLGALGAVEFVTEEKYVDMVTALSGTGPAYVFLFMEALIDAGVRLGLPRHLAQKLTMETVIGSALYARIDAGNGGGKHLAQLRSDVTSPAGTTAEAIYELEKAGFRTAIADAVKAAHLRCIELGKGTR